MTEIPEHLLKRSRERKAAMSGESGDSASAETPAESSTAVEQASAPAAAPAVAASASVPDIPAEPVPEKVAPYVEAYKERKKMPYWIAPVLLALPVWAMFYVGTLERVPQGLTGLLGEGEELYVESQCSGCHGAEGGGGIGPALEGGEVHITFTSIEDQMAWILRGSTIVGTGNNYASADSVRERPVAGQMPGYGIDGTMSLDVEQLLAVTLFERTQLEPDEDTAAEELLLAEQMNLLLETGELDAMLEEEGLSIHDVLDGQTVTSEIIAEYLAPAREAIAAETS